MAVMMYVKFPLSLRNVEDLLAERGIDVCHETVRFNTSLWHVDAVPGASTPSPIADVRPPGMSKAQ